MSQSSLANVVQFPGAAASTMSRTLFSASGAGIAATESTYSRDEDIYGECEPAEYVYQVISGAVRTYKLLNDGRRQIDAFHLPGDVFGLDAGHAHRLTAEAIIDTSVRMTKRRTLEAMAKTDSETACRLWRMTADELRRAQDHMLLLGRKNAIERVAAFLLEMDRRLSKAGMFALPMCRRDIGDYLGLTLETVSRTLSQLHDRDILSFSGARHIVLLDRARLAAMNA
jgi:CRP/FNR family transcriptional regulator, nitrogen fixation regulation protein